NPLIVLTLVLSLIGLLSPLFALGQESAADEINTGLMTLKDVTHGSLLVKTGEAGSYRPAPLLKSDVRISITGTIARTRLTQEFTNQSVDKDDWAEGIYVFPLPETAAVDHLRMTVGERTIVGEIRERAEAKRIYEQAKQEGKRAGLVEHERPNVFTTSVANIAPGDRITVEIEYQETVRYDVGTYSLKFPMVVGPRYIPGTPIVMEDQPPGRGWSPDTNRVPDASRITPPFRHPDRGPINPVTLTVELAAGFPVGKVESSSHDIITIADRDDRRQVALRQDHVPANNDFILTWTPEAGHGPTATLYTEVRDRDTYALFMLSPPSSDQPLPPLPREAIFVIDTSGSMAGASIEQAKSALLLALGRLTAQDRFNVIQFNSATHVLFSEPQPVNVQTVRTAIHYVDQLLANGGTEILPALKLALKGIPPPTHLRQVVFLTDGQVGNEEELFRTIRGHLGASRLFTIGIGSAPNSHFMRKAAEFGRGTFTHIASTSEVKRQMDALFHKLERPVLTDVRVEGLDPAVEMFPSPIPDLYAGEPVVVALKGSSLPPSLVVAGSVGSMPWNTAVDLTGLPARQGIATLWARRKIEALMDQQRYGEDESGTRRAILDVALAHHLVSKYTSLVAVDQESVRPTNKPATAHSIMTNLPEGQDYEAIFGLPRTATSGQLRIVLGMLAAVVGVLLWRARNQSA
ncbi:MAG TPA: marine proteobacterial sortase target protein, partial [Nitrospira sp.]|nr:marine proteobacterial sortase target protein [Nitrospira sp.]